MYVCFTYLHAIILSQDLAGVAHDDIDPSVFSMVSRLSNLPFSDILLPLGPHFKCMLALLIR